MRNLFLSSVAAVAAASAFMMIGSAPANAGAFCATYADGQGNRSCDYDSYAQCQRTVSGAGGTCIQNPDFGGYGYQDDSYSYAPGPVYVPAPAYGYDVAPRYYHHGYGGYRGGY
jgi:hypothetical protein